MKYYSSLIDLVGNTPLLRLPESLTGSKAQVFCKLEFLNPGGSIKDRMARYVISTEEKRGRLKQGDTICDNTSGNTGVGAAMVAAIKGYNAIFACSDKTSQEKLDLIKSYGAEVIVTPSDVSAEDPRSSYMVAKSLCAKHGYYWLNQYDNPLNAEAHYSDTGPEIWNQTEGKITHFVGGIGTGGTISGVGRFLKEKNKSIKVVGVEPAGSLFSAIWAREPLPEALPHLVEGIGTDMIVGSFHAQYVDRVIQVSDNESFLEARLLGRAMGLSVGGSTGSILAGVKQVCDGLGEDAVVVFPACDSGLRYITKMFSDDWMRKNNFKLEEEVVEHV